MKERNFAVSELNKIEGQSDKDLNRNLVRNLSVFKKCFKLIS